MVTRSHHTIKSHSQFAHNLVELATFESIKRWFKQKTTYSKGPDCIQDFRRFNRRYLGIIEKPWVAPGGRWCHLGLGPEVGTIVWSGGTSGSVQRGAMDPS